jgi:anti-anti-sigma factor
MIEFQRGISETHIICGFSQPIDQSKTDEVIKLISDKIDTVKKRNPDEKDDVQVKFDLKDLDYIASSFLRICIATAKNIGKDKFSIINTQPFVNKVFKIAGFDNILNIS